MFTQFTSYCNICFFVANKKNQDVTKLTINQSLVVYYPTKSGETWIILPEINSSHFRKMDGWKTFLSFCDGASSQVRAVSFSREHLYGLIKGLLTIFVLKESPNDKAG